MRVVGLHLRVEASAVCSEDTLDANRGAGALWRNASPSESWPVEAAVAESDDDARFLHIEIKTGLQSSSVASEGLFGLAIVVESSPTAV